MFWFLGECLELPVRELGVEYCLGFGDFGMWGFVGVLGSGFVFKREMLRFCCGVSGGG